ncbi:MAG: membrane protein insertase YidC [Alphaproteobacteria bacterium]|nr:membrane protein insertase YidC [Alphaproteobacteria bacterium]
MPEQRNLILAVVLSMAILLVFQYLGPKHPPQPAEVETVAATSAPTTPQQPAPALPAASAPVVPGMPAERIPPSPGVTTAGGERPTAIVATPRVRVNTPGLHGTLSLTGGRIDDLALVKYHETIDPSSPEIKLLSPFGSANPYYAEFGWVPTVANVTLPGADTLWHADRTELTPSNPVTLTWDNGANLRFVRTIAVDENYMFTITQRVENHGTETVNLYPYGLIARVGTPETQNYYIMHEGPLGVLDGTLKEKKYKDLKDEGAGLQEDTTGGWAGITDKYWLTALAPDQQTPVAVRYVHRLVDSMDRYQVDYLGKKAVTVLPNGSAQVVNHLFTGVKEARILDAYRDGLGITKFDLAIDFGWFYFLTKPFFYALQFLHRFFGNFGLAILGLTIIVKGLFFPLANKSYRAMSKMKKLQPEMKKLQERFADDKVRLNQEMMALYKREKANPAAGCLPVVIQIPVFFSLYKVLFVTIEMRQAPFYGWIHDLSAPDPTTLFNLFGLIPYNPPAYLMIGAWPLLMGITMFLQQKLNPQPADPVQAKLFMFLPLIFTFMLAKFPAGLVIYWAWNNLLSIAQQWVIMRRMGVKA